MRKIYMLILSALVVTGCFGEKTVESSPEETLKNFCQAVFAGDFDKAESLCDTLSMKEYICSIRTAWEEADSSVMTIVPAILAETEINMTEVIKNGQERTIHYELTAIDGSRREKTATVRKEEGEWKISEITDRH